MMSCEHFSFYHIWGCFFDSEAFPSAASAEYYGGKMEKSIYIIIKFVIHIRVGSPIAERSNFLPEIRFGRPYPM
jgi:hypothetical protein